MSIKRDLRRLVERLREVEPCPTCGIAKANREPPISMNHPGIVAIRNCPDCGGGLSMHFTMILGHDPPTLTPEQADETARQFTAQGMTPAEGWIVRPQIMEAMERLEQIGNCARQRATGRGTQPGRIDSSMILSEEPK